MQIGGEDIENLFVNMMFREKKNLITKTHGRINYDWPIKKREQHSESIYEGRWFVLFCNYEIHRTGMLQIVF
jgi:hypothetical protein